MRFRFGTLIKKVVFKSSKEFIEIHKDPQIFMDSKLQQKNKDHWV